MGPIMVAWLESCQAAVPSQPFPELLVISHAHSDSQRQMVSKLNGCGWNLGAGLIGHAHTRGLPRQGHHFHRHSLWMSVRGAAHSRPVISLISTSFASIKSKQTSRVLGFKEDRDFMILCSLKFIIIYHRV